MTTDNWLMIAPMLLILAIAIALIPFINRASVKFSKMAYESRQKQSLHSEVGVSAESSQKQSSHSEAGLIAGKVSELESQTQRLTRAIESLSAKLDDETLEALKKNASYWRTPLAGYTGGEFSPAERDVTLQEVADDLDALAAEVAEKKASTNKPTEPKSRPRSRTKR